MAYTDKERMKSKKQVKKTTVGNIHDDVLVFTAGKDVTLDLALVEADCLGSAAHATMLSKMPVSPRLFSTKDVQRIKDALASSPPTEATDLPADIRVLIAP